MQFTNNSIIRTVTNAGTDVLMTTTGTTTTCGAVLQIVDPDLDYDNSLTQTRTFTPTTGNAIKIEFTEFATDYDFLEIYNGPTTSSPL
jgi:hypothetical protein